MKIATRILKSDKWKINSRYGLRVHPVTKVPLSFHSGIDFDTNLENWNIYGLEVGKVIASGTNLTDGNYIWIEYPRVDLKLFHGHLLNRQVQKGDIVNENTVIGQVGSSGRSTNTHLHLGVKHISDDKYFNFENYEYEEESEFMINKKTITYLGQIVHIIEAKTNSTQDIQISILGDKFDKKHLKEYRDTELETQGYQRIALVNGGLFFTEGLQTFAEGIEKTMNVVNENDDIKLNKVMGLSHKNGIPYIYVQSYLKEHINEYRGALTSAFGLTNNGLTDTRGKLEHNAIFNAKSGRTIVGKKADGTIVFACFKGITGKSGLTGLQTVSLAKYLGLRNSVCLDGGSSVGMIYNDLPIIETIIEVKNGVALYMKKNSIELGD